jgi:hypothetical protein
VLKRLRSVSSVPAIAWTMGTVIAAHTIFAVTIKCVFFGLPWKHF